MYTNKVKKIAAVHDLSGAGRVSLTVVIPILSSMGFQVCPLPTAVLSSHTQYPHFSFLDLTDEMPRIISEWKQLGVQFDAIYTGYLGSPRQIQIVSGFIDDFRQSDSLVMIDPVLGDNGKLYTNFDEQMILEMRLMQYISTRIELGCQEAQIQVPHLKHKLQTKHILLIKMLSI